MRRAKIHTPFRGQSGMSGRSRGIYPGPLRLNLGPDCLPVQAFELGKIQAGRLRERGALR